jgi:hypothetical protein
MNRLACRLILVAAVPRQALLYGPAQLACAEYILWASGIIAVTGQTTYTALNQKVTAICNASTYGAVSASISSVLILT